MLCADLMKSDVECVSPETSIRDAARRMRDTNVGFLPVCDESMRAMGAITDRDIAVRAVADSLPPTTRVKDVLTSEVISCRPDDDIEHARDLMTRHQKSRIMCISSSGRVEGVISLSDIVQLGAQALREIAARESRQDGTWSLSI